SARTAVTALVSLYLAQLFRLPESYWAGISTLVVMQSTLVASLPIFLQQFAGTAVGAVVGGWTGAYFPGNILVFSVCVLVRNRNACALPYRMDNSGPPVFRGFPWELR